MEIRSYYQSIKPKRKLKFQFEKTKNKRPAWIKVKGLPKLVNFIRVNFGRKSKHEQRIQFYKAYLPEGLFLPIDYTKDEMRRFYDKWSEDYDNSLKTSGSGQNLRAAKFLLKKLKKYIKKGEILDLGAGTGLITEIFVEAGYHPATLVDYSQEMLNKAKKRKSLKNCKFIKADVRELNLSKKFDLILSFFSFGNPSYFGEEELNKILKIVHKHLKKGGIFSILGNAQVSEFKKYFNSLEVGIHTLSKENKFYTNYFVGRKK